MNNNEIKISYAHSFLCGHLPTKMTAVEIEKQDNRWKREQLTDKAYHTLSCFYYEGFVDSLIEVKNRKSKGIYSQLAHLVMEVNAPCILHNDKLAKAYPFTVCRLHLFFFPYHTLLYAIEIDEPTTDANALTYAHILLRDIAAYEEEVEIKDENGKITKKMIFDAPEYKEVLMPLCRLCDRPQTKGCFADMTETGNKLKIFQIISANLRSDTLLYELGTLSPVGCVADTKQYLSPARDYYKKIMAEQTISVFRNWKALALFDTVTLLAENIEGDRLWLWSESYFRLIYIHVLYQKTLLFRLNQQFRSASANRKTIRSLISDMKEQEHYYAFSNISYNFLPQVIYEKINQGLDLRTEREQIHHYLEQEAEAQEKVSERKLGRILLIVTIMTIFSAVYDGSSLIKDFFGWEEASCCYRLGVSSISLLVGVAIGSILIYNYYNKR